MLHNYLYIANSLRIRCANQNKVTWHFIIFTQPYYITDMNILGLDLQHHQWNHPPNKIIFFYDEKEQTFMIFNDRAHVTFTICNIECRISCELRSRRLKSKDQFVQAFKEVILWDSFFLEIFPETTFFSFYEKH